jgi:hypothetical protein
MGRFSGTRKVISRVSKLFSFKKKPVVEKPVVESEQRKEIKTLIESWKKFANEKLEAMDNYIEISKPEKHNFVRNYIQGHHNSNTITQKIQNTAQNSDARDRLVARKKEEDALKNTYLEMRDDIDHFIEELRQHTTEQINLANQEIANLENKLKDPRIGGTRKRRKYKKRH